MNGNEFDKTMTRYEDVEDQMVTQLEEEEGLEQGETLYDEEDENPFQNTVIYEEEDAEEYGDIEEQSDMANYFPGDEASVMYRLKDYYVLEGAPVLGSGGQAVVYSCYRKGTREIFAAKVHKKNLSQNKRNVIETIRDMPNECESIYKIYESGYVEGEQEQNKTYMIVTKQYDKLDKNYLTYDVHGEEKDYYEKLRRAVEDLNNALITMHAIKIRDTNWYIYHSDIKPQNIMWDRDGRGGEGCLVLIDFDGGVVHEGNELHTKTNVVESKLYVAPELKSMAENKVNIYTDYYSVGATLAELVAGVMPEVLNLRARGENEREYYNRHEENGVIIYEMLFPAGLPGYVQTLFRGLLYRNHLLVKERLGQKDRWTDKKLSEWINLVRAGRYKEAEKIPCGIVTEVGTREAVMPRTDRVRCMITYSDDIVKIQSTEEMAEQFIKHWAETVSKFVTDPGFYKNFYDLEGNVAENLRVVQENMRKRVKEKDAVFDKQVIEVYLSDDFKRENLRYYWRVYTSKEEFGKKLYAGMIASRDRKDNAYSRLPGVLGDTSREFNDILNMFSQGIVSEFLTGGNPKWTVDDDTLQMIRKVERHTAGDRLNVKTVENLYRIAFRLRGTTSHMIGKKIYNNYAEFGENLLRLANSHLNNAIAIKKQCMTDNGRLKVDIYAWMQETEGVAVCPTEMECEKF